MTDKSVCPVCDEELRNGDLCASDIELGTCHADCLKGSPVVDLNTGKRVRGKASTFTFDEFDR